MKRVSIDDAAQALGISAYTVRRRLKSGQLQGEREAMGKGFRWWVLLDDEVVLEPVGEPAPTREGEILEHTQRELEEWKAQSRRHEEAGRELRVIIARMQEREAQRALDEGIGQPRVAWWRRLLGMG